MLSLKNKSKDRNRSFGALKSFNPLTYESLIALWDMQTVDSVILQTGTLIGQNATINRVENIVNPGTYDLKSTGSEGINSVYPEYRHGLNGRPAASNNNSNVTGLLTNEAIWEVGKTYFVWQRLYTDSSAVTYIAGGANTNGTIYLNTAGAMRWTDNQSNTDETLFNGPFNIDYGLIGLCIRVNSLSSVDVFLGNSGVSYNVNPEDIGLNDEFFAFGRATASSAADFYGGLILDELPEANVIDKFFNWGNARYSQDNTNQLFVLAGQSNAQGRYTLTGAPTYSLQSRHKIWGFNDELRDQDETVAVFSETNTNYSVFTDTAGRYSMAPKLMEDLSKAIGGNIIIIPAARGGLQLTGGLEWGNNPTDPFDVSTHRGALLTRIGLAEAALGASVKHIIWQQGEADANSAVGANATAYTAAAENFVNFVRTNLERQDLTFSWGVISDDLPDPPHTTKLDIKTSQLALNIAGVYIVDTSDATDFPTAADDIHYNNVGLEACGAAHAQAYLSNL